MARKHHLVPRFYLDGFADPAQGIHVVNRTTGERHKTKTLKAARRSGFYSVQNDDGSWSEDVEETLGNIEGEVAAALRRVLEDRVWPPSFADRYTIAAFVILQMTRGADQRDAHDRMAEYMFKTSVAGTSPHALKAAARRDDPDVDEEELEEDVAMVHSLDWSLSLHPNEHLLSMFEAMKEFTPMLMKRVWTLIEYAEPCLITSDRPVLFTKFADAPAWEGAGLINAKEVIFPLDRSRLLAMTHPGWLVPGHGLPDDDQYLRGVPVDAAQGTNLYLAAAAHEWWFKHPQDDPVRHQDLPAPVATIEIHGPDPAVFKRFWLDDEDQEVGQPSDEDGECSQNAHRRTVTDPDGPS